MKKYRKPIFKNPYEFDGCYGLLVVLQVVDRVATVLFVIFGLAYYFLCIFDRYTVMLMGVSVLLAVFAMLCGVTLFVCNLFVVVVVFTLLWF